MHRTQLFAIGKPLGSFAHARLSTRICASYGEVSEGRLCLFRFGRLYKPGRDCQFADVLERRNPYGPLSVSISLPPEAWATLRKNPQDRTEAVRVLVEQYGGRLLAFYYCFGEYDGVLLLEAPDDLAAASVAGIAAGHLQVNRTTKLLTAEEGKEVMRKAGGGSFQRPT